MTAPELTDIPNIVATMRQAWPVADSALALVVEVLEPCSFGKHHALVREGEAHGKAYFLEQGMTRSYWVADGEEITTSFSTEGAIVFSMDELYYGQLSQEWVATVEPVKGYAIALTHLRRLVTTNLDLANWWATIHQNEYRRIHQSHRERLTLPAAERYAAFAAQFPEVCRRARLTDIASYLGVNLSTLSRIRARF